MVNKSNLPPRLKWGLISTARINRALIKPLRVSERNDLVAVASRSQETADRYAAEWEIPRAFGSYEAMLEHPGIDVVYNSLPNSLHAEWTVKALQAGKHVLCEKPLATTLEDVDAMQDAAKKSGCHVVEAFMYRHHPQTLKVKEMVEQGAVGNVRMIKGEFTFNIASETNVRLDPDLGGGSVWDVGCYPISYARYILGLEPEEVFGWQVTGNSGVDEVFSGQVRFPGGVFAQFDSGFRSPYRSRIEIVGSQGAMVIPRPFNPDLDASVQLWDGENLEKIKMPSQELYLGEVEDLADVILLGKLPRMSLEDSRNNVKTILALLRSAHYGKPETLA
jgi:xylose dehydrogenase (NAD/NADP)